MDYLQDAKGRMNGRIGAGRDNVPTSPRTSAASQAADISFLGDDPTLEDGMVTLRLPLADLLRILREVDAELPDD